MSTFTWSYSALSLYTKCPLRWRFEKVDKLPTVRNEKADRGVQIHKEAEDYVSGLSPELPESLAKFKQHFAAARRCFVKGQTSLEQAWGYDRDWSPCDFKSEPIWLKVFCDMVVFLKKGKTIVVIDYKTGKRFGNEIAHGEQLQLYIAAAAQRYPDVTDFIAELWYLDVDELISFSYTREDADDFVRYYTTRAKNMEKAIQNNKFEPIATIQNCKFCPFKQTCEHAVSPPMTEVEYREMEDKFNGSI